jgi:hypothetical protein
MACCEIGHQQVIIGLNEAGIIFLNQNVIFQKTKVKLTEFNQRF